MLPLLAGIAASLAKEGLSLLGNAVLAKGKDVIEEKLGVDIEDSLKTTEGKAKLLELQFKHEKELNDFVLAKREQDLRSFSAEAAEKDSARKRDVEFLKAGTHNWRADVMFFLAVAITSALVYLVWADDTLNEYAKGIFTLVLGRFLGYLDNIYNYEFGTTRSSRTKDATIERLSGGTQ